MSKNATGPQVDQNREDDMSGLEKANAGFQPKDTKPLPDVTVCNEHETPLIWTFAFPYAEWFCMAGNHAEGMLGAGHKVEATPELLKLQALYNRRWAQLKKHIVVGRFWRNDCKKCKGDEYHNDHLTDAEKRRSEMVLKRLEEYATQEVTT